MHAVCIYGKRTKTEQKENMISFIEVIIPCMDKKKKEGKREKRKKKRPVTSRE
jgi:hypothetical protein